MIAKDNKYDNFMCFWQKHNLVRPNHECERRSVVLVQHIHTVFQSLCTFWRKLLLILCLNELILSVGLKSEDRLFHIFVQSKTDKARPKRCCETCVANSLMAHAKRGLLRMNVSKHGLQKKYFDQSKSS